MAEIQNHPGERIAKIIARAGLCSRRDAEAWVSAGRVSVNGKVLDSPAINVQPEDTVLVDGQPLGQRERTRLFFFHKPRGTVTTAYDPEGRTTVFDALPGGLPRVVTVGRLDINTEGLLLLTNDGGLARALELPSTGWLRRYRVRAHGRTDQAKLDELGKGLTIEGVHYRGIEARLDREQGSNVWLTIGLREGKNREVRKVLEHIGLEVNRLIRLSFGPFQLGELEEGAVEEVKTRILQDQLGEKIAQLANADFDAPLFEETPDGERREVRELPKGREDRGGNAGKFVRADDWSHRDMRDTRQASPEEPRESPKPGKRRHISTLRDDARNKDKNDGARKRIERGQTADRHGRSVAIERVVPTARRARPEDTDGAPVRRSRRNARNFAELANPRERSPANGRPADRKPAGKRSADSRTADAGPRGDRPRGKPRFASADTRDGSRPRPSRDHASDRASNRAGERPRGRPAPERGAAGEGKFKRPERDYQRPRGKRPDFQDTVVPDRIPWGAPQDDEHVRARPERTERPRVSRSDSGPGRSQDRDKTYRDKPYRERASGERPRSANPRGDKGYADAARSERPRNDKPRFGKPSYGKPNSERPDFRKGSGERSGAGGRDTGSRGERSFAASKPGGRGPARADRDGAGGRETTSRSFGGKGPGGGRPAGRGGPGSRGPAGRGPGAKGPAGRGSPRGKGPPGKGPGGGRRPTGRGPR